MLNFGIPAPTGTVPVGLLTAAIDLINVIKPKPADVDDLLTSLVLRLDYDRKTASALTTRIRATARMFGDPMWPIIRQIGHGLPLDQRLTFETIVRRFIAAAPLDPHGRFDVEVLRRALILCLPASGGC